MTDQSIGWLLIFSLTRFRRHLIPVPCRYLLDLRCSLLHVLPRLGSEACVVDLFLLLGSIVHLLSDDGTTDAEKCSYSYLIYFVKHLR